MRAHEFTDQDKQQLPKRKFADGYLAFSDHFRQRLKERNIRVEDVAQLLHNLEVKRSIDLIKMPFIPFVVKSPKLELAVSKQIDQNNNTAYVVATVRDDLRSGEDQDVIYLEDQQPKIKISTDPGWLGAEVGDYKATGPVVKINIDDLVGLEPTSKMKSPKSQKNLKKMMLSIAHGEKLPPILVRELEPEHYQILDGHHRFHAYKLLGKHCIPAQIVPDADIDLNEQQLNELTFMGMSQCTRDCSGHRAGYAWSKAHGGASAASWSPSFNKGAEIASLGY